MVELAGNIIMWCVVALVVAVTLWVLLFIGWSIGRMFRGTD